MNDLLRISLPSAIIGVAVLLLFVLVLRNKSTKQSDRVRPKGPGSLRYECVKCKGQFIHSDRTIGAWEKGNRRTFCDSCHKKWLASKPKITQPQHNSKQPVFRRSPAQSSRSSSQNTSGCLGVLILLAIVPIVVVYANYIV
jgi:hypothetical protein